MFVLTNTTRFVKGIITALCYSKIDYERSELHYHGCVC